MITCVACTAHAESHAICNIQGAVHTEHHGPGLEAVLSNMRSCNRTGLGPSYGEGQIDTRPHTEQTHVSTSCGSIRS